MNISICTYILLFVLCRESLCEEHETSDESRIVAGWSALIKRHPYHAYIEGQNLCGGAIIGKSWILTAANCEAGSTTVYVGSHWRGKGTPHNVKSVITMPLYENKGFYHEFDFMLLELAMPVFYSQTVQAVNLGKENDIIAGKKGLVTGFGVLKENGPMSKNLRKLELTIQNNGVCANHWHKNFHADSQLCASSRGRRHVWTGDMGGPFVVDRNLIGIVSFAHKGRDEVVMLSSVPAVRLWIYRVTGVQ